MNLYPNGQAQIKKGKHNHSTGLKVFKRGPEFSLKMLLSSKNKSGNDGRDHYQHRASFLAAKSILLNIQEFPELDLKLLGA